MYLQHEINNSVIQATAQEEMATQFLLLWKYLGTTEPCPASPELRGLLAPGAVCWALVLFLYSNSALWQMASVFSVQLLHAVTIYHPETSVPLGGLSNTYFIFTQRVFYPLWFWSGTIIKIIGYWIHQDFSFLLYLVSVRSVYGFKAFGNICIKIHHLK